MKLLVSFKRYGVLQQTVVAGAIFLAVYSVYMVYIDNFNIFESLLATIIFALSYFVTSTFILHRRIRSRR